MTNYFIFSLSKNASKDFPPLHRNKLNKSRYVDILTIFYRRRNCDRGLLGIKITNSGLCRLTLSRLRTFQTVAVEQ